MHLSPPPVLNPQALPPGTRLALAVSGGADSVALLHLACLQASTHGWQLSLLHVQHGLRGQASLGDQRFVEQLAIGCKLPIQVFHGALPTTGLEDAGRRLRYGWFRQLLLTGQLDAVATGHTLDDQAETVLAKILRGSWTAGLAGIYPVVHALDLPGHSGNVSNPPTGVLVRPLLAVRRAQLRAWLTQKGLCWREDVTNHDPRFTRNRIRHTLLPALAAYHPHIEEQLSHMSELAREDESYWQAEVARLLPQLLLPGRPVRGGGRSNSTRPGEQSLAIELEGLQALPPALIRRLLRATAERMANPLDFDQTARVLALLQGPAGSTPRREQLSPNLRVERTPRELRFVRTLAPGTAAASIPIAIPGEGQGLGVHLRVELTAPNATLAPPALLRTAQPGDRVRLRHSSGAPKRVKEVLERLAIPAPDRAGWPVLEWQGELIWLRGALLEPTPLSVRLRVTELQPPSQPPV